ncbi:MAG: hypothetical protein WD490_03745 [Opitutales bacterium]
MTAPPPRQKRLDILQPLRLLRFPRLLRRLFFYFPLFFLLLVTGVAILGFRPWTIHPPAELREPVTVTILDYGRHSRLALPGRPGEVVEYSTGEWHYYALRKRNPWRITVAMSGVSRGSLGRRFLPEPTAGRDFPDMTRALRSSQIQVEQEKVSALLEKFEKKWQENVGTRIHYSDSRMSFVDAGTRYHLFRNSNHQVAEWLEFLGCEIEGHPILSNFRVEESPEGAATLGAGTLRAGFPWVFVAIGRNPLLVDKE